MSALPPEQQALLDWLAAEAAARRPCPTNTAIGERFGASGNSFGTMMIDRLEDAGHIFVEKLARGRIVTIVRTGDVTARPPGSPPPRAEAPATIGRPALRPGEKRKSYEGGAERIRDVVTRTERAPLDQIVRAAPAPIAPPPRPAPIARDDEPGARPDGDAPDITIGADTIVARGIDAAPPLPAAAPASPEPEPVMPDPTPPIADDRADHFSADVACVDGALQLTVYLSFDEGPMREFRPFLTVPLTEMHALEVCGSAAIALQKLREAA